MTESYYSFNSEFEVHTMAKLNLPTWKIAVNKYCARCTFNTFIVHRSYCMRLTGSSRIWNILFTYEFVNAVLLFFNFVFTVNREIFISFVNNCNHGEIERWITGSFIFSFLNAKRHAFSVCLWKSPSNLNIYFISWPTSPPPRRQWKGNNWKGLDGYWIW